MLAVANTAIDARRMNAIFLVTSARTTIPIRDPKKASKGRRRPRHRPERRSSDLHNLLTVQYIRYTRATCPRGLTIQACQRPISPQIQHAFANKILKASHQCRDRSREEMRRYETITCAIHACKLGHTEPEGGSKVGTKGLGRGGRRTICHKSFGPLNAVTCESAKYAV